LQVYEIVGADVVEDAEDEDEPGSLHAVVRADVCVGCAACVPACPEEGAIHMQGKLAVVERSLCVGHGKCAEACPVGGILMSTGAAVHRVEVPDVGADFQTNVPGVYLVGELGGRGLIKNAINEGKLAAENIATALPPGRRRVDADPDAYDVVIVGSGPAGLSAALESKRLGLSYVVLEQGSLIDTIRKYPRKKLLLAEPVHVPLYGDLWIADGSKEELLRAWDSIIRGYEIDVRTEHRVESVSTLPNGLHRVQADAGVFKARRVILAMGRRGTPRRLGVPGEELGKVFYDIIEMEAFQGQRVLVVGGGDSALESAVGLGNQPDTEVTLSYRGDDFSRAKERNREKVASLARAGKVKLLLRSRVEEIREGSVLVAAEGGTQTLPNDTVIIRIGGIPPLAFLGDIGVRIVKKDVPIGDLEEAGVA
jgi:thioredoxin reductase/NAD-dependent dihydropyrimidine dehydrogenase PreA subunit